MNAVVHDIVLRKATVDDVPFMRDLYSQTRWEELSATGLPEATQQQFLAMQFAAQYQHYMQHYNSEAFNIIAMQGKPVGRLFVDYWESEIRVVDITLLPEHRGKGIGSYLLKQLFEQAEASERTVTIHVERNNPARRLYERLGFVLTAERDQVHLLMTWQPQAS